MQLLASNIIKYSSCLFHCQETFCFNTQSQFIEINTHSFIHNCRFTSHRHYMTNEYKLLLKCSPSYSLSIAASNLINFPSFLYLWNFVLHNYFFLLNHVNRFRQKSIACRFLNSSHGTVEQYPD